MKVIPKMYAKVNEQIKAQFEDTDHATKDHTADGDISGYMI